MRPSSVCVDNLRRRFRAAPMHDVLGSLHLETGSLADYTRLSQFHYKIQPPGVVTIDSK